ncbi:C-X-C chemokine receptor type 4 [Daphnia magna]|nr:C-X-C chemokine receptor type 4 [Daphnia magna]
MSDDAQNMSDINWHGLDSYPLDVSTEDELVNINTSSNRSPSPIESLLGELSGSHSLIFMENAEEMLLPWKNNPNFLPIVLTHVITFVIGLAGNIVVISTMSRGHGERSVTSMFLVSLAVADLLLVAVSAPLETMGYFLNPWTKGGRLCQLQYYVEMLSAVASVLNLTAVSLERYLVIVYPMKSRSFCTLHNCRRALIAVWIFALLLTAPSVWARDSVTYIYYNNKTSVAVHYCMDTGDIGQDQGLGAYSGFVIALYQLLIMLVFPLLLMIICYSRVIQELWLSTKQITAMTRECNSGSPRRLDVQNVQTGWGSNHGPGLNTVAGRLSHVQSHPQEHHHARKPANKYGHSRSGDGAKQARKQVIKMLILVVLLFLVCWGPRLLLNVIIKWGLPSYDHTVYQLRFVFYLLPFVHSCINPVIYGFMSTNFRRMMVRCCTRRRRFSQMCSCFVRCCEDDDAHSARPNSVMFEMSNGTGLRRHGTLGHTSAYCVSIATTEATLATAVPRGSLYQERPGLFTTDDM